MFACWFQDKTSILIGEQWEKHLWKLSFVQLHIDLFYFIVWIVCLFKKTNRRLHLIMLRLLGFLVMDLVPRLKCVRRTWYGWWLRCRLWLINIPHGKLVWLRRTFLMCEELQRRPCSAVKSSFALLIFTLTLYSIWLNYFVLLHLFLSLVLFCFTKLVW